MKKKDYTLKVENIIKQDNSKMFMGIKIENDDIKIFVPSTFRKSNNEKERNKDILLYLRSISVFSKQYEKINKNKEDLEGTVWPIDSYLWIIHDFIENGFYYNRELIYSNSNQGKIDWRKTLKNKPIVSKNNLIYTDFVTKKMSNVNDEISNIYRICISLSLKRIGWLFNYSFEVPFVQTKSIKEMLVIMNQALSSTFDDIKRKRFTHMLNIIKNVDNENIKTINNTFGIYNYDYVFERMVDSFFNGISANEIEKYYPHGSWHLLPNVENSRKSSMLREDTIYNDNINKKTYIIDAKMYKYGGLEQINYPSEGLPETTSIQKQITYGDYVSTEVDEVRGYKVRNAFILPFNKEIERFKNNNCLEYLDKDHNLAYIGYSVGDWRQNKNDYDYLFTFLLDLNYLIRNYQNDNKKYIEKLMKSIEIHLKK